MKQVKRPTKYRRRHHRRTSPFPVFGGVKTVLRQTPDARQRLRAMVEDDYFWEQLQQLTNIEEKRDSVSRDLNLYWENHFNSRRFKGKKK